MNERTAFEQHARATNIRHRFPHPFVRKLICTQTHARARSSPAGHSVRDGVGEQGRPRRPAGARLGVSSGVAPRARAIGCRCRRHCRGGYRGGGCGRKGRRCVGRGHSAGCPSRVLPTPARSAMPPYGGRRGSRGRARRPDCRAGAARRGAAPCAHRSEGGARICRARPSRRRLQRVSHGTKFKLPSRHRRLQGILDQVGEGREARRRQNSQSQIVRSAMKEGNKPALRHLYYTVLPAHATYALRFFTFIFSASMIAHILATVASNCPLWFSTT